jgi:hypothetical protein
MPWAWAAAIVSPVIRARASGEHTTRSIRSPASAAAAARAWAIPSSLRGMSERVV